MKFFEFKKIQSRLIFWFLVTSFIPLLISMTIFYIDRQKVNDLNTFEKLISIRDLKVSQLNKWLDERIGDVHVLASDMEIRGLDEVFDNEDSTNIVQERIRIAEELLKRSLNNYEDYSSIFIVNANTGQIDISTHEDLRGKNSSQELYFKQPMQSGELYISPIIRSETTKKPEMYFSLPIYGAKNSSKLVGILVAQIDLDISLYDLLLNRIGLGQTGETLIVNKDVVALNELRWFGNAPLRLQITADPAIFASQGKTGIIKAKDYRNVKVLAAYTYVARTGWGLICKQDSKELNAPLQKTASTFLLILVLVGAVIIIITVRFSNSISKPIVVMNEIAQRMRLGDFTQRNEIHSVDELGLLEMEFNNMADEIESRINIQRQIHQISETMLKQNELKEFIMNLLNRLIKVGDSKLGVFYVLNESKLTYEPYTSIGVNEEMLKTYSAINPPKEIAQSIYLKELIHFEEISWETLFSNKALVNEVAHREIITIPIVVESIVVALILLLNNNKFDKENIQVLRQSQTGINTSYSNILASERTRILSEQLTSINQQLEEQTEELQDQAEELQEQATELKNTTLELQRQNTLLDIQRVKVEEANKLKSEFLSNMSHELRTPLNSIMALSKVLIEQATTKLNEEENSYLEIIERNGKRLLTTINDILDLSKIEAGKMDIVPQKVSIGSLLQTTTENLQTLAEEKNLALKVNIPKTLPLVTTDEFRLHQVLTNIIGNAIKFTEKGEVVVSAISDTKSVKIIIEDTGIGISEDMLEHIFDEFRQVDGSTSRRFEGTGLGLAIARKIISILGGNISVKSKLGEGTEFIINLPVEMQSDQASEIQEWSKNRTLDKHINKKVDVPKILLVEDNQDTVLQMMNILTKKKYSVVVAKNGYEALDYLKSSRPNGIILDLMMPKMDGFEFLHELRKSEKSKNLPVLVLTAKDLTKKDVEKLRVYNVEFYLQKGEVDLKNLFSGIETMLGRQEKTISDEKNEKEKKFVKGQDKKYEILVVEDNLDNLITIRALIGKDYKLEEATSGEKGLNLIEKKIPDLILLDMSLSNISGEEFFSRIKEKSGYKNIPVIAVTAQAMKGDKERFIDAGFDGYVTKPIDSVILNNEIIKVLTKISL